MSDKVTILGVALDNLTQREALRRLANFIESGQPHHVVTVNPEFVMIARNDAEFRHVLKTADLVLADGIGLIWASRLLGQPLKERVTGVDTTDRLAALAAEKGYRMFLLGAREGVSAAAGDVLQQRYPGLMVAGAYAGTPSLEDESDIVERVRTAAPHILLVAYGAPEQDLWIRRNLASLGVPLAMGVGGAFDFISGRVPRAPRWMQRAGLEWLYRLIREPKRWRRMLRLPRFALLVLLRR